MKPSLLPDAALAQHIAILGKTGSGKSWAAKAVIVDTNARRSNRRVGISEHDMNFKRRRVGKCDAYIGWAVIAPFGSVNMPPVIFVCPTKKELQQAWTKNFPAYPIDMKLVKRVVVTAAKI